MIMKNDHTCHSKATNVILMNGCGLRYGPCFVFVFFSVFARLCRDPGARKSKTQPIRVNECEGEYMGHVLGAGGRIQGQ